MEESHKNKIKKALKGRVITWGDKISKAKKGKKLSAIARKNMSLARTGKKRPWQTVSPMKGKKPTAEHRRKLSESHKGSKSYLWKGGITHINKLIRGSVDFKLWREAVFKRDNWTCIFCLKRGGELHPDHIKPFAFYPELRFAIDNGRTLCKPCHLKTDTWGNRKNIYGKN